MLRSGNHVLTADEDPPTPEPTSAIVQAASAEKIPEQLQRDLFVRYMMDPPPEDVANVDALFEAGDRYGDDHERALADLLAGRHPLQRSPFAAG